MECCSAVQVFEVIFPFDIATVHHLNKIIIIVVTKNKCKEK